MTWEQMTAYRQDKSPKEYPPAFLTGELGQFPSSPYRPKANSPTTPNMSEAAIESRSGLIRRRIAEARLNGSTRRRIGILARFNKAGDDASLLHDRFEVAPFFQICDCSAGDCLLFVLNSRCRT